MWIDMFPNIDDKCVIPKPVNISPLKPIKVQLRVIIYNTKDVKLVDSDWIINKNTSDIYVKGWLGDKIENAQKTDVHRRSSTGEGNFNFRFVYDFEYLTGEKKVVTRTKGYFNQNYEVKKSDPVLHLQVYDAEYFESDTFIGRLELNLLNLIPKAQKARDCKIKNMNNRKINLFEIRKINGWWPFVDYEGTKLTVSRAKKLSLCCG